MSLKGVEQLLEEKEVEEVKEVDFEEDEEPLPKRKRHIKEEPENETRIETLRGKDFIRAVDARKFPCKYCTKSSVEECKNDLAKGATIEFYRPTNTCVTHMGDIKEDE